MKPSLFTLKLAVFIAVAATALPAFAQGRNSFKPFETAPADTVRSKTRQAAISGEEYVTYGAFLAHGLENTLRWRTVISVMNPSNQVCLVLIEFLDSRGNPVALPFSDNGGKYHGDFTGAAAEIDPGVNVSPMLMDSRLPAQAAYVRVTSRSGVRVHVDISVVRMTGFNTTAFVYPAIPAAPEAREINVASSPGQQTSVSILNPGTEMVEVVATARTWQGAEACSVKINLSPGQQIWSSVNSLLYCVRPNSFTYTLNLAPSNGPIVVGGYYEQAGFATAPIHMLPATSGQ